MSKTTDKVIDVMNNILLSDCCNAPYDEDVGYCSECKEPCGSYEETETFINNE